MPYRLTSKRSLKNSPTYRSLTVDLDTEPRTSVSGFGMFFRSGFGMFFRSLLKDQHAVAIREEAIFLSDRVLVGRERQLPASEGRDQNQKTRLRQVEVGQQRAGAAEGEAGSDEEIGLALRRIAFDGAHAG